VIPIRTIVAISVSQVFIPLTLVLVILALRRYLVGESRQEEPGAQAPDAHVGATSEPLQLDSQCAKHIRALSRTFPAKTSRGRCVCRFANRPMPVALFADNGVAAALMLRLLKRTSIRPRLDGAGFAGRPTTLSRCVVWLDGKNTSET